MLFMFNNFHYLGKVMVLEQEIELSLKRKCVVECEILACDKTYDITIQFEIIFYCLS